MTPRCGLGLKSLIKTELSTVLGVVHHGVALPPARDADEQLLK